VPNGAEMLHGGRGTAGVLRHVELSARGDRQGREWSSQNQVDRLAGRGVTAPRQQTACARTITSAAAPNALPPETGQSQPRYTANRSPTVDQREQAEAGAATRGATVPR